MNHGVTILDGHGWYTGQDVKVLCVLAKKHESTEIFRLIKMTDPNAFVSQSAVIGVYGEGFDKIKVNVDKKKHGYSIRNKQPEQARSEEHTSELQSRQYLVCRLLLEKKKK